MIWHDMIWYDSIWFGIIWYDMIWCDMILRYVTKFELMTILFLCYGYDVFDMIVLIPSSSWLFEDNHYHFEQYVYLWLDLTWRRRISDHIVSYRIFPLLFCSVLLCSALLHFIVCYNTLLLLWSVQYFIRIHDMTWHDMILIPSL